MDVEDLRSKTTRLIEQTDQHDRHLNTLAPLLQKVQFLEAQVEEWQEFQQFKRNNRDRMRELRHAIHDPAAKVGGKEGNGSGKPVFFRPDASGIYSETCSSQGTIPKTQGESGIACLQNEEATQVLPG